MGFVLISSVSAVDDGAIASNEISDYSVSEINSSSLDGSSDNSLISVSSSSDEISNTSSSNVNSENEVLSADTTENADLETSEVSKNSKNVLSSSSLQASAKTKTTIKGGSTSIYRGNSYSVTLTDGNGKLLANQNLSFTIKGKSYARTTNSNGIASLNINLAAGKYPIVVSYAGTSSYNSSKLSVTLTVTVQSTSIKNSGSSIKKGKAYSFTLLNASGKALANQNVTITIKGKSYTKTTNSNGVASLTINLVPGKYSLSCAFSGSKNYKSSKSSLTLSVLKGDPTIKTSGSSIVKGNAYSITLVDARGVALSNQKVSFTIKGKSYTKTTNSNGLASLNINLAAGKYSLVCSYAGSSSYNSAKTSLTLTVTDSTNAYSIANIATAANTLKSYVEKNKTLPSTVTVGGKSLKMSEFSYLMSKAISNINSNNMNSISLISGISNGNSLSSSLNETVYKNEYVNVSKRVSSYIESNKVPAAYAVVYNSSSKSVGNAGFNLYTFAFAKILAFYKSNGYLPNYCTFDSSVLKSTNSSSANSSSNNSSSNSGSSSNSSSSNSSTTVKTTSLTASTTSLIRGDAFSVTLKDSSGNVLANQKLSFTLSGNTYNKTTNSNGVASLTINLVAGKYSVNVSFAGTSTYKSSKFSSTITVTNSSSRFFLSDIKTAAENVKTYVSKNTKLPTTVTVGNTKLTIAQFSYIMAKAIHNINAGNSNYISLPSGITGGNSTGSYLNVNIYKNPYLNLTDRVISYIESNKVPPSYGVVYSTSGSSLGKAEFNLYTYAFAKILAFHKTNSYLPTYCLFASSDIGVYNSSVTTNVTSNSKINANSSQFKTGLNEKNTETNLTKYLTGTGYSAITTAIKNLATQLTKNLNSTEAKALAIYNYVRDKISYSYYANSKYGADGTLSRGYANCVDHSNLIVALCRAANIPARYSHAQGCTFSSGLVTGHVWAQILVNGVWYSADATSSRNSLGNIVNWNTNYYYSLKQYAAVPF